MVRLFAYFRNIRTAYRNDPDSVSETAEDIALARQMDLLTYLQCHEPQELVRVSGNTYCTRSHDSLKYPMASGAGGRAGSVKKPPKITSRKCNSTEYLRFHSGIFLESPS